MLWAFSSFGSGKVLLAMFCNSSAMNSPGVVWVILFFVDVPAMVNFHDVDDQLVVDDLI